MKAVHHWFTTYSNFIGLGWFSLMVDLHWDGRVCDREGIGGKNLLILGHCPGGGGSYPNPNCLRPFFCLECPNMSRIFPRTPSLTPPLTYWQLSLSNFGMLPRAESKMGAVPTGWRHGGIRVELGGGSRVELVGAKVICHKQKVFPRNHKLIKDMQGSINCVPQ